MCALNNHGDNGFLENTINKSAFRLKIYQFYKYVEITARELPKLQQQTQRANSNSSFLNMQGSVKRRREKIKNVIMLWSALTRSIPNLQK